MRTVISRRPEPELLLVVVQDSTISNTIIVLILIEGTILSTIESSVPDRRIMDSFIVSYISESFGRGGNSSIICIRTSKSSERGCVILEKQSESATVFKLLILLSTPLIYLISTRKSKLQICIATFHLEVLTFSRRSVFKNTKFL